MRCQKVGFKTNWKNRPKSINFGHFWGTKRQTKVDFCHFWHPEKIYRFITLLDFEKKSFFPDSLPTYIGISSPQHQPTAIELTCDQSDLQAIRDKFGSRAHQTIINMGLAFDAYLRWYYPYKTAVPFMCDLRRREERALDNMRST